MPYWEGVLVVCWERGKGGGGVLVSIGYLELGGLVFWRFGGWDWGDRLQHEWLLAWLL